MREFDAGDGSRGVARRLEPFPRRAPALDRSMVLFDHIVEVLATSNLNAPPCDLLPTQDSRRSMTWNVAVEGDFPRWPIGVRVQCFAEEGLSGSHATVGPQQEVHRLAVLVDCTVPVVPPSLGLRYRSHRLSTSSPLCERSGSRAFSNSGTYRTTHQMIVLCETTTPRSAIIATRSR